MGNKTPRHYRNPFLVQAMMELNMIDTMEYGIHEMHLGQPRRFFPLPDYDLTESSAVSMTIFSKYKIEQGCQGIKNKRLNEQVKRNIERFPLRYRFQLTSEEKDELGSNYGRGNGSKEGSLTLKSQIATSSSRSHGGRRTLPYVYTEQGVSMLSAVLKSETAIKVSIQIIDAFVNMRKFITNNAGIFQRLDNIEQKQLITDTKLDKVLDAIELKGLKPKQGIFYEGQIFDAYKLLSDIPSQPCPMDCWTR